MLRIGLTGGIGSGKSTVAKVFETLGIPVYYADEAARRLMNHDPAIQERIKQQFGAAAYTDGKLNRPFLAEKVFSDQKNTDLMNAIVHPATLADAEQWMKLQSAPYAIKEAALIFESGGQQYLDKVIGVYAPAAMRIHRVMQRNKISREAVTAIMNKQIAEEIKLKLCDYVIVNDEGQLLIPQIISLHQKILKSY